MITISVQSTGTFVDIQFPTFPKFAEWHLNQRFSCHYEIIKGTQNAYFDIDGKAGESRSAVDGGIDRSRPAIDGGDRSRSAVDGRADDLDTIAAKVVSYFRSMAPTLAVLCYSSSDSTKASYHVVVRGVHFASHLSCGKNAKLAMTGQAGFDDKVYTSVRKFRLLGSRKIDSTRIKRFTKVINLGYYSDDELARLNDDPIFALHESMVSIVETRRSQLVDDPTAPTAYPSTAATWTPTMIANAVAAVNERMPGAYTYRDLSANGILNLKRLKPASCQICDRIHDNEGAFVVIRRQRMVFYCRRDTTSFIMLDDNEEATEVPVVDTDKLALVERLLTECHERCLFYGTTQQSSTAP